QTAGQASANPRPAWFPRKFDALLGVEASLRLRYNPMLPLTAAQPQPDVVHDYLVRQSLAFSLAQRKAAIQAWLSAPSTGYAMPQVRDTPSSIAGLLDSLGHPRWPAQDWAWHDSHALGKA